MPQFGQPRLAAAAFRVVFPLALLLCVGACRRVKRAGEVKPETASAMAPRNEPDEAPAAPGMQPVFTEVARRSGIDFSYFSDAAPDRFYLPEVMGGGAGWVDFDQDGRWDLYLVNGCELEIDPETADAPRRNHLYRNLGQGRFEDVTLVSSSGDSHFGHGCAVGDYDSDGFPDLYVSNFGANVLLHNNGDGTYEEATAAARVDDRFWSFSCLWVDLDRDQDLDLYVTNYLDWDFANSQVCERNGIVGYCGPEKFDGLADRAFLNLGNGQFVESADRLGLSGQHPKGLGVASMDLDGDLRAEVYVGNDESANFLFTTTDAPTMSVPGHGSSVSYHNVARAAGCAVSGDGRTEASMGIVCLDYNRDGNLDLFLTHFFEQKSTLYAGGGRLDFQDVSHRTGIAKISWQTLGFGSVALDYDRDGWQDLVVANGHVLGPNYAPSAMRPQLLKNVRGQFEDVSVQAGGYFSREWLGRGLAAADYDNDGDLDLAVSHLEQPAVLLRNDTPSAHHFVGIELQRVDRLPPVGGRVVIHLRRTSLVFPIVAGGSYLSSHDSRLLCGLGAHSGPVTVEIFWPSGYIQTCKLGIDRYWLIMERQPPQAVSDS